MNKVILTGRLTRDPEIRYTTSGKAMASFSLAVERRHSSEQSPTADFIPCIAWTKLADWAGNYLSKGSKILLEGRLQVRSYDAQDGSKRYVTEVIASEIEFAESKKDGESREGSTPNNPGGFGGQPVSDDDIPF